VALGAAPAANAGPHTGCYRPTADRVLRIIPKADSCLKGERRISWHNTRDGAGAGERGARGPRGAKGAKGDKGDPGAVGANGATGATGAAGAKGDRGLQGVQGEVGAPGATGATGATGPAGPAGAAGTQGPPGPAGADGTQGPPGPAGADGTQGPAGPAGADGAPGPEGPEGPAGPAGPAGTDGAPGSGAILSASTGQPAIATTVAGGLADTLAALPPSGYGGQTEVTVSGGAIDFGPTSADPGQVMPRGGTITSVAGQLELSLAMTLVGSTVTPTIQVWRSTAPGGTYAPIPGAVVTLAPALTGVLVAGTPASGITTGLSIPVEAGDRLLLTFGITSTGVSLVNTVAGRVTTSLAIS
jgi:BclB C-terminal domain-containing protein